MDTKQNITTEINEEGVGPSVPTPTDTNEDVGPSVSTPELSPPKPKRNKSKRKCSSKCKKLHDQLEQIKRKIQSQCRCKTERKRRRSKRSTSANTPETV